MTEELKELREKDRIVLQHISEGRTDTHQITQATTLQAHEVRYSFNKLEELGLVTLEKPDCMVERVVNGQKRVFKAPTEAQQTKRTNKILGIDQEEVERYKNLSQKELTAKVRELEAEVQSLQRSFEVFRKQVQRSLE